MFEFMLFIFGLAFGGLVIGLLAWMLRRAGDKAPEGPVQSHTVAERVRAVGKLVGLEVRAKEIATSTKGWSWLPPIILSQAKVAMIFHFEKQYSVDLRLVRPQDVEETSEGRYRLRLPAVQGVLRLTDIEPYDIQAGRALGLLDVIQMNAATQKSLMQGAQDQAAKLFEDNEPRYDAEARTSIERQLSSLLGLFDVDVEPYWADEPEREQPRITVEESLADRLAISTN